MVRYAGPGTVEWVESGGGPLAAVPESVLADWTGADGEGEASDYDRACEVDGCVGLLPVGARAALVLGDEPAATAYLPGHGAFVRWCAADCEDDVLAGVPATLAETGGEPDAVWDVPGPVLLFDAAWPGADCERADPVRVPLELGRYAVHAADVRSGPETWLQVVRLRRLADGSDAAASAGGTRPGT